MTEETAIFGLVALVALLAMLLVQIGTLTNEVQRIRKHITETTDNDSLRAAKFDVAYIFGLVFVVWLSSSLLSWAWGRFF